MSLDTQAWQEHDRQVIACRLCPRLVAWREEVARTKRRAFKDDEYWGKPVPGFGDWQARLVIVGLAPGAHGSNRTGRMFTGDSSGDFLYAALHRAGFANHPSTTRRDDGLELKDVYITATCRCVPPDNKPAPEEMLNCRPFLLRELELLTNLQGFVALGKIGFDTLISIYRQKGVAVPALEFKHGAQYSLGAGQPWLISSYHPSRQNTQTGRLTVDMFDTIWSKARKALNPT